ncbi:MAG: arginine--tRNA ligase, partial [Candidatus Paceibacterota bacterium]
METILRDAITAALYELGIADIDFTIEHPSDYAHGDYATNAALIAIRTMESPPTGGPLALAKQLVSKLKDKIAEVDSIEVAGPGFINFYLSREFFTKTLAEIDGKDWGTNDTWKGKTVLVEYTDPNPFKEFHIGHLFTNSVGESISRLFEAAGANVKRVNYQGDVGMHVAHAVWGMRKLDITADSEFSARDLGRAYALGATAYKEDETFAREMKEINKLIYERSDEDINALYDKGRAVSLKYFESIYDQIGTTFDYYFFES